MEQRSNKQRPLTPPPTSPTSAPNQTADPDTTAHPRPHSLRGAWLALLGLSAVFLIEMLDTSVLNVALPTIATDLSANASQLQWASGAYALVFGGLMLAFGAIADRFGRRRVMLIGLSLFGLASAAVVLVTTPIGLIVVRVLIGVAAAMTAPGAMALSFRLFDEDALRVRATALISTVGLVGLAIGPTLGGLLLAVAPWPALLLINVPIAVLALVGVRFGIAADDPTELHRVPIDILGALLGTVAVIATLLSPTLFVDLGAQDPRPWIIAIAALLGIGAFIVRERHTSHPLVDPALIRRPAVSLGLTYQAALGLATAGLGYTVTLQLQLAWGWPPALAALGSLPQVLTMILIGPFVDKVIRRVGMERAGHLGAGAVVMGLVLYAAVGHVHYVWIAVSLVLVAAGMRVVMIAATISVMRGLPKDRTSIGAALNDTAQEIASGIGIAVTGTVIAAAVAGSLTASRWTASQASAFEGAVTIGTFALAVGAAALIVCANLRVARTAQTSTPEHDTPEQETDRARAGSQPEEPAER
ncbi:MULTISPECIES: MFS transporter [Brevibacterium]|uniref:MFS transporter n=1 Tax=Brevibacterium casei TaxID=33889 RepID=A0A7T3ZZX0_9MICO|nr:MULTISPECIES: MFS transporter [Brevibacterium]QQB14682.1 MFS transporter [Brevibacterium casei]